MGPLAQALPCVRFELVTTTNRDIVRDDDHIQTIKGTRNGCNSIVGRRGGRQVVIIDLI